MINVLSIIGTRPEAIKMAPVVRALEKRPTEFRSTVCVTAQHREMMDQVLGLWGIIPDHDLDIMRAGQTLTDVTSNVLLGLAPVLQRERPDWILVQGDTTTAMAGSLAGFYERVPVGHVEAGLRTHDNDRPFPEEVNRRITGVLAKLHFAPTQWAADNLLREGIPAGRVHVTGNTVIDAFRHMEQLPFDVLRSPLKAVPFGEKRIVAVTAHRRENFGQGIENICSTIRTIVRTHPDVHVVMPVHPNPHVYDTVHRMLGQVPGVTLLRPLEYQPMVWLLRHSHLLITDSGGLQEEATGVGKPVLVMRTSTERPEGVEAGSAVLVGTDPRLLLSWADRLLLDDDAYRGMALATSPYGFGDAAERIVAALRPTGMGDLGQARLAEVSPFTLEPRHSPDQLSAKTQTRLGATVSG